MTAQQILTRLTALRQRLAASLNDYGVSATAAQSLSALIPKVDQIQTSGGKKTYNLYGGPAHNHELYIAGDYIPRAEFSGKNLSATITWDADMGHCYTEILAEDVGEGAFQNAALCGGYGTQVSAIYIRKNAFAGSDATTNSIHLSNTKCIGENAFLPSDPTAGNYSTLTCDFTENAVAGAPWGYTGTITYQT